MTSRKVEPCQKKGVSLLTSKTTSLYAPLDVRKSSKLSTARERANEHKRVCARDRRESLLDARLKSIALIKVARHSSGCRSRICSDGFVGTPVRAALSACERQVSAFPCLTQSLLGTDRKEFVTTSTDEKSPRCLLTGDLNQDSITLYTDRHLAYLLDVTEINHVVENALDVGEEVLFLRLHRSEWGVRAEKARQSCRDALY